MLTVTTAGKSINDAVSAAKSAVSSGDGAKILVDGASQADAVRKSLEEDGYSVVIEDDDGNLYLTARKAGSAVTVTEKSKPHEIHGSLGVILSSGKREYSSAFTGKLMLSMLKADIKPDLLALMNSAVKTAAYNSPMCVTLRKLEAMNVRVLVSEQCATRLGVIDAVGAGVVCDMAEILDEISSCSKIISI